jgi:hypothetical protein
MMSPNPLERDLGVYKHGQQRGVVRFCQFGKAASRERDSACRVNVCTMFTWFPELTKKHRTKKDHSEHMGKDLYKGSSTR